MCISANKSSTKITFNTYRKWNKSSSFFQLLSFATIEEIPVNPPHYTSYCFSPYLLFSPPHQKLKKGDPPQVGKFYSPYLSGGRGGGHWYIWEGWSYIVYLQYVVTHPWKLQWYNFVVVVYGLACPKFSEITNC